MTRWLIRIHFQHVLPLMARISTGSEPAQLLMKYYWDTIDQCVPPETILDALRRSGFVDVKRRVTLRLPQRVRRRQSRAVAGGAAH